MYFSLENVHRVLMKRTLNQSQNFENEKTIYEIGRWKDYSPGGGGTWVTNIRGGAAGKSKKLPCPGVKFLKMIPCPGVKFTQTIPYPLVSSDKIMLCKEICTKSIEKCRNTAFQAI